MRGKAMHLVVSVCVCIYFLCDQKINLFSALPFKNILLSVLYYLLV